MKPHRKFDDDVDWAADKRRGMGVYWRGKAVHWPMVAALIVGAALIVFLGMCSALPANAQERLLSSKPQGYFGVGHEQFHQQYSGLKNGNNGSCCNGNDCRPTQARWNNGTGTLDVMVNGVWRTLRPQQSFIVLTPEVFAKQGRERWDSQAHVCANDSGTIVYCVIPGASGG